MIRGGGGGWWLTTNKKMCGVGGVVWFDLIDVVLWGPARLLRYLVLFASCGLCCSAMHVACMDRWVDR